MLRWVWFGSLVVLVVWMLVLAGCVAWFWWCFWALLCRLRFCRLVVLVGVWCGAADSVCCWVYGILGFCWVV